MFASPLQQHKNLPVMHEPAFPTSCVCVCVCVCEIIEDLYVLEAGRGVVSVLITLYLQP